MKYCLDTNALIQPWNFYYSMELCPDYWTILDRLADRSIIFCTTEVHREIEKVDDDLSKWIKSRRHLFRDVTDGVQQRLRDVLRAFPRLVDSSKDRSMADPWVIAHAMTENATVVTKERASESLKKIKIPDVCKHFGVRCISDFQFVTEIGIRFKAVHSASE